MAKKEIKEIRKTEEKTVTVKKSAEYSDRENRDERPFCPPKKD